MAHETRQDSMAVIPQPSTTKHIFPFQKLSAELRNAIYELSLVHDRTQDRTANTALLRVNKQIHNEAQPMLLPLSTFYIRIEYNPDDPNIHITGDAQLDLRIHRQAGRSMKLEDLSLPFELLRNVPRIRYDLQETPWGWITPTAVGFIKKLKGEFGEGKVRLSGGGVAELEGVGGLR